MRRRKLNSLKASAVGSTPAPSPPRHAAISLAATLLMLGSSGMAQASAPAPAAAAQPEPTAPTFEQRLAAIDEMAARIADVRADFEQLKHSSLLTEPLKSSGEVLAKGGVTLWVTRSPEETRIRIDPTAMRVFYLKPKVVEEYPIDHSLGTLASSPLPKLATLRGLFAITEDPGIDLNPLRPAVSTCALKLTPTSTDLAKHVSSVRVLLDASRGVVLVFEITDADGEQTTVRFSSIRTDEGISDDLLELHAPADAKVVKPFDGKQSERKQGR